MVLKSKPNSAAAPLASVLIVQADSKEALTLLSFFSGRGAQVWLAANTTEALPLLKQNAPALLVLDLHLPDSLDFLRQARETFPNLQIIITNKNPDLRREILAKEQGAYVFLRQPFTREWIEKALQRLSTPPTNAQPHKETGQLPEVRFPISLKISIPYVALALALTLVAGVLLSRYVLETFQERLNRQLVSAALAVNDQLVEEERALLVVARALAHTTTMAEAVQAKDPEATRALALPVALNNGTTTIALLDAQGQAVLTLHRKDRAELPLDYDTSTGDTSMADWPSVQAVLSGTIDTEGDKFAATQPDETHFYVVGPILTADNHLAGVVVVGISLRELADHLRTVNPDARVALYTPTGAPLAVSGDGLTEPLAPSQLADLQNTPAERNYRRTYQVGAVPYGEILGPWHLRNGTAQPGWLGVAFLQQDLASPNIFAQAQLYLFVIFTLVGVVGIGVFLAHRLAQPLRDVAQAAAQVANGNLEVKVNVRGNDEVAVMAHAFNYMVSELQEGTIYRDLLGRTVSPEVRDALRASFASGDLRLEGQNMVASVLMSDIRDFTTVSEKADPATVLAWLNEYFSELVPVIAAHGGVVDKFEGDALLVFFGILPTPIAANASAYAACRAAVNLLNAVDDLNTRRAQREQPPLLTGLGINTGLVTAGGLGTTDRLNYTIIGDTVNTAQRLERHTRNLPGSCIVLSQETYEALGERRAEFDIVSLGPQLFKGKTEPITVYHLRGLRVEPSIKAA